MAQMWPIYGHVMCKTTKTSFDVCCSTDHCESRAFEDGDGAATGASQEVCRMKLKRSDGFFCCLKESPAKRDH